MITFKQFILEDAPSPGNVDTSFEVADVRFDNENGLGSTPHSANIMYRGAVAWMKPSEFRRLAKAAERGDTAKDLEKLMRQGKPIAVPWLDIDVVGDLEDLENIKVVGHEGRARADAFKKINGDIPMPVQLQLLGIRAKHLNQKFFDFIKDHGLQAEGSQTMVKPDIKFFYWDGKKVS